MLKSDGNTYRRAVGVPKAAKNGKHWYIAVVNNNSEKLCCERLLARIASQPDSEKDYEVYVAAQKEMRTWRNGRRKLVDASSSPPSSSSAAPTHAPQGDSVPAIHQALHGQHSRQSRKRPSPRCRHPRPADAQPYAHGQRCRERCNHRPAPVAPWREGTRQRRQAHGPRRLCPSVS